MTIAQAYGKISQILALRESIVEAVANEMKPDIASANRRQMFEGKRADGSFIVPEYAPATIVRKQKKGQPTDRVTLKDTGSFYSKIFVTIASRNVFISSSDSKTGKLTGKYGERIFGISDESSAGLREKSEILLVRRIKSIINQ